ncbi:tol-pal system YbgF family protein [Crenalkalicoccus roseus]|uniref:tetratricopeptide repeat protein n=1 Tax=Crenalkalicoccus roseus TaxID=1485588 RepID=UPI0013053F1E|nr:tetratricopeptide repeat protein [Crenalkalicoccus roseus]
MRPLLPLLLAALLWLPPPAAAQMDSREAIALQNQILQLRQELELLRRGAAPVAPPIAAPPVAAPPRAPQGELVGALLDRVAALEEEVRRMRGRVEELEFRNRQLAQSVEKLQGDMDFRLQQLEGQGAARQQAAPAPAAAPPRPAAPPPAAAAAPRPPERAIAEGQAALGRRDYAAAEAAAREALAQRNGVRAVDANILLGDALTGRRDFAGAALAYNEAYTRNRTGPRAPEALLGLANAFVGLNNRREACDTLDDLRSNFPNLRPPLSERAAELRRRAGCR